MTIKELREFIDKIPKEYDDYTLVSSTNNEDLSKTAIVTEMEDFAFSIHGSDEKYCCVNMYMDAWRTS